MKLPSPSYITHSWFWWCAGGVPGILKDYPSDQERYFSMGLAIFLTAMTAALTMSYAMNYVFHVYSIALLVGLLWGLIVFNLDRTLVMAMRKPGSSLQEYLFSEKLGMIMPQVSLLILRLVLAVIVGHAITIPLELRIFEQSVEKQMQERLIADFDLKNDSNEKAIRAEQESHRTQIDYLLGQIQELEGRRMAMFDRVAKERDNLEKRKKDTFDRHQQEEHAERSELEDLQEELSRETNGTNGRAGWGKAAKRIEQRILSRQQEFEKKQQIREQERAALLVQEDELRTRRSTIMIDEPIERHRSKIDDHNKSIADLEKKLTLSRSELEQRVQSLTDADSGGKTNLEEVDFRVMLEELFSLLVKHEGILWTHYTFLMIIMLVEILPVFIKLISKRGAYESHMDLLSANAVLKNDSEAFIKQRNVRFQLFRKKQGMQYGQTHVNNEQAAQAA